MHGYHSLNCWSLTNAIYKHHEVCNFSHGNTHYICTYLWNMGVNCPKIMEFSPFVKPTACVNYTCDQRFAVL